MNKEQIKQQIEDLKANLKSLEDELNKPDKFEFKYKGYDTYCIGICVITENNRVKNEDFIQNFRYRQTEANTKEDFQLQKELMAIGSIAEQIDPDYKSKIDWNDGSVKYYIAYDYGIRKYEVSCNYCIRILGLVYMPKDVAERVCDILNKGEVEL